LIRNISLYLAIALAVTVPSALAQQQPTQTKLDKILARTDLSVSAVGIFNTTESGTVIPYAASNAKQPLSDQASNTVGEGATLRYIQKPYVGLEFNYINARYTENYCCSVTGGNFGVQTGAREMSFGWVVTPHQTLLGFQPYVSAGAGTTEFRPTPHGGESLPNQYRATYYYSLGLQGDVSPHFGLRVGFRQAFLLAPDFGQNYLTILKHTTTYEPTAGLYLRF
jgi:hypothetical protein